jgi:hypothetical protein
VLKFYELTPLLDVSILHNPTTPAARKPFRNEDSNGRDAWSRDAPFSVIDARRRWAARRSHGDGGGPV